MTGSSISSAGGPGLKVLGPGRLLRFAQTGVVDGVQVLHRGKARMLTRRQWRWIKRRQAVEPVIGHLKEDCRLGGLNLQVQHVS